MAWAISTLIILVMLFWESFAMCCHFQLICPDSFEMTWDNSQLLKCKHFTSLIEMGLEELKIVLVFFLVPDWWWWLDSMGSRIIPKKLKLEAGLINTSFSTLNSFFPHCNSQGTAFPMVEANHHYNRCYLVSTDLNTWLCMHQPIYTLEKSCEVSIL